MPTKQLLLFMVFLTYQAVTHYNSRNVQGNINYSPKIKIKGIRQLVCQINAHINNNDLDVWLLYSLSIKNDC